MKINRRQFLGLLGLATACKNNDMQFAQHGIIGNAADMPSGEVFWILGDSVARGNSDAAGDDPNGVLFQYDADNDIIVKVGALDLIENQDAGTVGSQWPRFGIDYYERTGRKATLVQTAIGGSGWNHGTLPAFSWATTGDLYAISLSKYTAAINRMTAMGLDPTLRGVFINLGINDAVQFFYTQDYAYLTSLIDRINTDAGTPKIYITLPFKSGSFGTPTEAERLYQMRTFIKRLALDYSNVIVIGDNASFTMWDDAAYWQADDFHLTYAGNNLFGQLIAKAITLDNGTFANKETIGIVGGMYTMNVNSNRKTLIDNFISSQKTAGNWTLLDRLHVYLSAGSDRDRLVSWLMNRTAFTASTNFGTGIITDGSTNHITTFSPTRETITPTYTTDFIWGVRTGATVPAAGSAGALFGVRESATGGLINLNQSVSNVLTYYGCDATSKTTTEPRSAVNTYYSIARNGGTKYLLRNSTIVDTQVQAAVALSSAAGYFTSAEGARLNHTTVDQRLNIDTVVGFTGKYVGFNMASFITDMEYLITHWND